jgi:hypothetical protein
MSDFSNRLPPNNDLTQASLEQLCKDIARGPSPVLRRSPEGFTDARVLTDTAAGASPSKLPTATGSLPICFHDLNVIGVWMRKSFGRWYIIVAWSNPGAAWFNNPEYGILADDGKLIAPLWSDWAYALIHGHGRYETCRCHFPE